MINRRGILALLGGAAASDGLGVKAAAKILGVDPFPPAPMPIAQSSVGSSEPFNPWWGSKAQIALDARRSAIYEAASQDRYAHMKSWGPAFKRSVVEREIQIERMLEHRCQSDAEFVKRVFGL